MADRSSPRDYGHRRESVQSRRGGSKPSDKSTPANSSGRRKACNECRQQKLRCDLASTEIEGGDTCGRCQRLGLDCKIENGFQRTRKRRRSVDYESEIRALKSQLDDTRRASTAAGTGAMIDSTLVTEPLINPDRSDWSINSVTANALPEPQYGGNVYQTPGAEGGVGSVAGLSITSPVANTATTEGSHTQAAPGLTTRPDPDEQVIRPRASFSLPRPRALGNTVLSVEEIQDLFKTYELYYHHFLPVVDISKTPHEHYEQSDLLFWSIISVAARRLKSQPTMLPKLARSVTDLLWRTVRTVPHSLEVVQALAVICTWPFPTSSSSTDPTFMLVGLMLQIGSQMGLHRALDAQEFAKVPVNLSTEEQVQWGRTWECCRIVAQSVSIGCGLPLALQPPDAVWPPQQAAPWSTEAGDGASMAFRVRIEQFKSRVSSGLMSQTRGPGHQASMRERLVLYRLLDAELAELCRANVTPSPLESWHLAAGRVHLHAFYLVDDASSEGYQDRICTAFLSACALISRSLELDREPPGFFQYCPFYCYQVFVCASIVVLKILSNGFFRSLLDVDDATRLVETAIASLRSMSVMNNDLPARLGDVIGFFCALPDITAIGGTTIGDLQLTQVTNRLSMSVVYDCLWTWRRHFTTMEKGQEDDFDQDGALGDVQNILGLDFSLESWDFLA